MALPVITLKHLNHRGGKHIALFFDYNLALIAHTKKIEGVKWSASNKCWYIQNAFGILDQLFQHYKNIAWIDVKELSTSKNKHSKNNTKNQKPGLSEYKKRLTTTARKQLEIMAQRLATEGFSNRTIDVYRNMLELFMGYVQKDATALTLDDIRDFQFNFWVKHNYSRSTQRQFIAALKHLIEAVPGLELHAAELILPKKDKILPKVLSQEEVIMILKNTRNIKHLTILSLLYSSGLRISELIELQEGDIDINRNQIHIRKAKGRKDRYVGLSKYIVPVLVQYIEQYKPDTYLFNGQSKLQYTASSVRKLLGRAARQAGIKKRVYPHMLRHSYATHMLETGVDIRYIQELLGHRKPETTMIYTHVTKKQLTEIVSPLDAIVEKLGMDKGNADGQKFLISGK